MRADETAAALPMTILLAVSGWDAVPWRRRLAALLPSHSIATLDEPFDRASVRYALSWRHPPGALANLPHLEAIFSLGAGVDHLFADPALPDAPIVRVVDPDLTNRMSEWVVMHALIHLRQLRRYERQQRERIWADDDDQPKAGEIQVGVLGLGVLGADAATKLGALGFSVAGWSASEKSLPGVACFHGRDGLERLLAQTDLLVVLLPLTEATRGMIDASLLSSSGRAAGSAARSSSTPAVAACRSMPTSSPRSIPDASGAPRSTCSSASRYPGIRASGPIPPSTSARTTPRSHRPKPSPPSSPARSRLTNAASRCATSSTGGGGIEAGRGLCKWGGRDKTFAARSFL
jgi:glyoxylate/hydroxypyruvate reductase